VRLRAAWLGAVVWAAACNQAPTTITVRVDVPTGPPVMAAFLGVTLTPFGDGGARFYYDVSSDPTIDSGGHTLVVILPDDRAETLNVEVDALGAMELDGGPAPSPLASGAASVTTVPYRTVAVTVHLAPP
jgi:hypothetical protein